MQEKYITIYKSSAGSGKTYTLVKEYLVIVLADPNDFRHVLAVTFTNKATDEMKERVIRYLVELKEGKNGALEKDLKDRLPAETNIKKNADLILKKILHNYSDFAITTIDSFFISIVRSLARELSLPARYDVELNQGSVADKIALQLFDDINTDSDLRKWLKDFMLSKLEDEKGWKIEKEMKDFAMQLFSEEYRSLEANKERIDERSFLSELQKIKSVFENSMKTFGEQFNKLMSQNGLLVDDFYYGKSGFANYMSKLSGIMNGEDYTPKQRILSAAEAQNPDEIFSKKSSHISNADLAISFQQVIHSTVVYYSANSVNYFTALSILKLFHVAGIVHHLDQNLKKFRDKNNLLMISDTNLLLKDILKNQEDTPFIYEKVGNKFRYFLIDEFQDTSDFQWYNLLPLLKNSLASGFKILIVGDAKQSIYRWRGGNMQLLLNGVERDLKPFKEAIQTINLSDNYRSRKEIVNFNNVFFPGVKTVIENDPSLDLSEGKIFDQAYHPQDVIQHSKTRKDLNGFVQVRLIEEIGNDGEADAKWKDSALKYSLSVIQKLLNSGYAYSDLAILVRKNSEGSELIDFLYKNEIRKVISGESLLIKNSHRVNFLINLLNYLLNPYDEVVKAQLLFYYQNYLNYELAKPWFAEIKDFNEQFSQEFIGKALFLKSLYLPELLEELILIFQLNKTPDAYIQRLQDLVIEHCEKQGDLNSFIKWWDEEDNQNKISVVMPAGEDAITVISMHKSKGLQYPVVIIPFLDWELKPKATNTMWVDTSEKPFADVSPLPVKVTSQLSKTVFKENYDIEVIQTIMDNINLVYVAFTRPENQLYIFSPLKSTDKLSRVSQLFGQVFNNTSGMKSLFTETSTHVFEFGKFETNTFLQNRQDHSSETLSDYLISPWQHKLGLKIRKDAESDRQEQEYGIYVHQLLSEITSENDIVKILEKINRSVQFSIEEKKQVQDQVSFVADLLKEKGWLSGTFKIKTEVEIALPDGNYVRPDRLMIKDNEVILLDYKTGLKEILHSDQLKEYDKVLADTGYIVKEKYLLYLTEKELIKID